MIKEAMEYLLSKAGNQIHREHGQTYSTERMHLVERPTADPLVLNTLKGIVDYINENVDRRNDGSLTELIIHIKSPERVEVVKQLNDDRKREVLIQSIAWLPEFIFDRYYDSETFNIKLQSCFVQNEERDIALKVVGNIKQEAVKTYGDDGTSQSVVARTGVASVESVVVPNPITLAPRRTFVEIEQPESNFIFRMKDGPSCALFEADGGAWKHEAMRNIREYLEKELSGAMDGGSVMIIS
ncbi:hypothetical protein [Jeotgalibacillus haloalkalitolerans]|uniref:Uncharacterized protein n=1 Tax=Jeotgalibacillus haloalkalitolerans TaxID=3104292 RepID=A0ABU5KM08_9BACL|nr:hypothetical protein [Jeotgalibacillus sp. HH7-29]MDZ5712264.1 hypothetical protein [Jeotgalibacillus sp. HH7-29]